MSESFVSVAFVSNSSFVAIYNNQDIEIVSIANCISPLPSLTWEYVFGLTKIIGLTYDDQKVQQLVNDNIIEIANQDGIPEIQKRDMLEISSSLLKEIKRIVDTHLDLSVKMLILSVPDNFNRKQQEQVRFASTLAGFDDINIITESAAAARELKSCLKSTVALYRFYKGNFTIFIISLASQCPVMKILYEDICITDDIYFEMWKKGMANPPNTSGQNPSNIVYQNPQWRPPHEMLQQYTRRSQTCVEQKDVLQILRNNDHYKKFHLHGTPFTINRDGFNITINLNIYDKAVQQVIESKVSDIVKRSRLVVSVVSEVIDLGILGCELPYVAKHFAQSSYRIDSNFVIRSLALHGWKLLTLKVTNPMKELKIKKPKKDESVDTDTNKGMIEEFCRYKKSIIEMRAEIEQLTSSLTEATEQNKQLKNEIEIQKRKNVEHSNMNSSLMKNLVEYNQEIEELRKMVKQNE